MSAFQTYRNNPQGEEYNGGGGEQPADNDNRPLLEDGQVSYGENPRDLLGSKFTRLARNLTMGQGFVTDAEAFNNLVTNHQDGASRNSTKGIMAVLRDSAVEVGSVESTDTIVNAAFDQREILTKGSAEEFDENYEDSWTDYIEQKAAQKDPHKLSGWGERVTLKAYRLSIRDAAAALVDGVLTPLLRREEKGILTDKIWEFLSIRAVVQHKWDLWAARCLFLECICFLGWIVSFVCFLLVYIGDDISEDYDTMDPDERGAAFIAYIANASSVIFMSPFLVKAFNSVVYYGWERLQMWSIIDVCCYFLQLLISVFHYYHFFFAGNVYTSLLAVHCVLLFVRIQYYCRVMEVGAAYVESLKILIAAIRGLLLFIVLTALSAALSFATLYKWDIHYSAHESNEELEGFSSFPRSIITTFSVLLGNFEPAYVFDTENKTLKGIFFIIFEAIISIAVLNLMIAVMTQSYAWILSRGLAVHNRCRAETIDRLEVTLPRFLYHKYEPYIHFLVREDEEQVGSLFTHRGLCANTPPTRELQRQLEEVKASVEELKEDMSYLIRKIDQIGGHGSPSLRANL